MIFDCDTSWCSSQNCLCISILENGTFILFKDGFKRKDKV